MKKKHSLAGRVTVTATAAALLLSTFITPVSAASGISCTVNGQTIIPSPSAAVKTIDMEQTTVLDAFLKSNEKLNFYDSDNKQLNVVPKELYENGQSAYSLYAVGSVSSSIDVYAEDSSPKKLFTVKIIDRPFQSDTTMSVAVNGSYTFKITPNNPNTYVTAYTTDGSVFDTNSAGKSTSNSKTSYYFKLIGKQAGSAGVYVTVGKTNYRVFTATASVKKADVPSSSQTAIVKLTGGYLNFRSSPNTNSTVIGQLKNGESVTVLGISGGWTHVQTADGVKGYCCSDYLVAANDGSASAVSGSSKTLSGLPCYKQKDSRWANTYLGGSNGGTIGAIGCAVTCLAMSESYRTQKTVTPNMIKNQCQFTDGGGLYWPSNYSQDIVKNLADIYKCLKANKPVIVGGYSSKSSHWIIVKGYKNVPLDAHGNPTSLDASMFLINDPGYDNYTLADYISQFPYGRVYWTYS